MFCTGPHKAAADFAVTGSTLVDLNQAVQEVNQLRQRCPNGRSNQAGNHALDEPRLKLEGNFHRVY